MRNDKRRITLVRDSTKGTLIINRNSLQDSIMGFKLGNRDKDVGTKEQSEPKNSETNKAKGQVKDEKIRRSSSKKSTSFMDRQVLGRKQNRTLSSFFPSLLNNPSKLASMVQASQQESRHGSKMSKKDNSNYGSDSQAQQQSCKFNKLSKLIIKESIAQSFMTKRNNHITIRAANLKLLMTFLIDLLTAQDVFRNNQKYPDLGFLSNIIPTLDKMTKQLRKPVIDPKQYNYNDEAVKLKQTIERRFAIERELQSLQRTHQELTQQQKELNSLKEEVSLLQAKKTSIEVFMKETFNPSQIPAAIQKKVNNYNFKEQNRQNYFKKCSQYRETEAYMLEYATYLHNNKLAVSLDFDSSEYLSKLAILDSKKDEIFQILNSRQDLEKNALRIKYFIQDTIQMYSAKNEQMSRLCNLKTHCVCSFIRNVKAWLKNWEFKQDVLTNLKKMFVVSSVKMRCKIDDLSTKMKKMEGKEDMKADLADMKVEFNDMVEYFKMGNSFY